MTVRIHVLTGATAGSTYGLESGSLLVGRHLECALRFDASLDLEVSARHALILLRDGACYVRDLGSTNGTYVNGVRVAGEARLADGDRVAFGGAAGPTVEVRLGGPAGPAGARGASAGTEAAERLHAEIARRTRRLKLVSVGAVVVAAAAVAAAVYAGRRERAGWERERTQLNLRVDSLLDAGERTERALEGQVADLAAALRQSRDQVERSRAALRSAEAGGHTDRVPELRRQLQAATTALTRQQLAATLDFHGIQAENRRAIALVYVEHADGTIVTGTAFAVRADATLATNRHVVYGADGRTPPRRIGVQFSDSEQVWPARLLPGDDAADLALVKIDNIDGEVPTVHGLNLRPDTLQAGAPVASIGFPLGGETPWGAGARGVRPARPLLTAGVLSAVSADRLEVQGYGAPGASGSPIFDATGAVVGILYGGRHDASGQMLLAVPASALAGRLPAP